MRDGAAKGKIERLFRTVRSQFLIRDLSAVTTLEELNTLFLTWVEDNYHQAKHSTLGMKPIDRYGLDLNRINFLQPSPYNKELFYVEQTRNVRADNTFQLRGTRYEAPRDLRNLKIEVRCDRFNRDAPPIVYSRGDRLGEAWPVNFTYNDRGPKFEN